MKKMDKDTAAIFHDGAALFLDLDSPEVDRILAQHGLSTGVDTLEACRACIRQHRPIAPPPFAHMPPRPILYIGITEAATSSGLSRRTINAACLRGDIEGAFQGTRNEWQIPPRAFQKWLDTPDKHLPGPKKTERKN